MIKAGKNPGYRSLVPGVIGHREYMARREDWDDIRKCIGLDGEFYEGAEVLLYPPMWLDKAHRVSNDLRGAFRRARAIGIDTAEGGDKTAFAAVDEYGIIEVVSLKTPNTAKVPGMIRAFMHKHKVGPDMTVMDQGGGGKGHWDRLRENEEDPITIRMVAFGSPVSPDEHYGYKTSERKQDESGERYRYKNRRAQMFGALRELLDPSREQGWGIPAGYMNLRKELAPIPLLWDEEGRMFLPPKRRRSGDDPVKKGGKKMKSLEELIGHSPDEADAVVLAIFGMQHPVDAPVAGTAW
jgi:hypothetical protein